MRHTIYGKAYNTEPEEASAERERRSTLKMPNIMKRSYQRSGVVAKGTLLSSGARQVTVAFPLPDFRMIELAADNAGVSLSEMVRQLCHIALEADAKADIEVASKARDVAVTGATADEGRRVT